ncbi:MAG: hypothetical protein LC634_10440, partial [Sphingomonadales bacterium]|nr:hypothetical protein [Sphingomonadales bacterium]
AEAGEARFAAIAPVTERAVGRAGGSPAESEAWIVAQVELSALDAARSPTVTALGALDAIFAEQAIAGAPAESAKLAAAREQVSGLYDAQTQRFARLQAALNPR